MQSYSFLTVSDVIDRAKAEAIGATTSQLTALQDTQLIERVEQINSEFINSAYTRHSKGGWSWMLNVHNFNSVSNTTLNGAVAASAATFVLTSGTNFGSSGRLVIETAKGALDFVDYSGVSSNTVTVSTTSGDQTVSIAHATSERVERLYSLQSDFAKTQKLFVNSMEYFYEHSDLFPWVNRFTFVGSYIFLPRGIGARDITHYYFKKPATLTTTTGTTDIPVNFQRYAVEKLKAHIYMVRRKREDVPVALQLSEMSLEEALSYDTNHTAHSSSYGGIDTDY